MFINKIADQPNLNPQKMSSYINTFLKTELTCIPKLLSGYLGNYYNNALCNGATWVFLVWYLIHALFDKTCNVFLKKLRYREYVRIRLKSSLWYMGFFGTALVYCGATLNQNEVELFNFKRMHVVSNNSLPMQVVMGYTLICTFYIHSALWEGLSEGNVVRMCKYMFLFAFMVSSYILRVVEISFTLTALISVAQVTLEFTRCCFMATAQDKFSSRVSAGFTYFLTFLVYLAIHVIVIPLTFVIPLGIKIISDYPNILLIFLFFNLFLWLVTELYNSVVFKLVNHWLYHKQLKRKEDLSESTEMLDNFDYFNWCSSTLLECSLFKPRDDDSYNLMILREEIKARKNKMLSMRKPKNMFLQTLKCMVAIKRKLSERQKSSDSSDSDSEKSESGDHKAIDNTDDDVAEDVQSDEDTDNEESDSQEDPEEKQELVEDEVTDTKDEETKETNTSDKDEDPEEKQERIEDGVTDTKDKETKETNTSDKDEKSKETNICDKDKGLKETNTSDKDEEIKEANTSESRTHLVKQDTDVITETIKKQKLGEELSKPYTHSSGHETDIQTHSDSSSVTNTSESHTFSVTQDTDVQTETIKKQTVGEVSSKPDTHSSSQDTDVQTRSESIEQTTALEEASEPEVSEEADSNKEDIVEGDSHALKTSNNTSVNQSIVASKNSTTTSSTLVSQEAQNQGDIAHSKE